MPPQQVNGLLDIFDAMLNFGTHEISFGGYIHGSGACKAWQSVSWT